MTPELWKLHHWHQLEGAYPHGPLTAPACHVDAAAEALCARGPYERGLVIGPGTFHEPKRLMELVPVRRVSLITMFAPEKPGLLEHEGIYPVKIGDMHDMPFETGSFDLIFSSNVMEHAMSPYIALMECRRVLKPDGVFYAVVPEFDAPGGGRTPWHLYCFDAVFWTELMGKCGLMINPGRSKRTVQPEIGPGESYLHLCAVAVTPPAPHDQALEKLILYKAQR